jgi:hypothetical protein
MAQDVRNQLDRTLNGSRRRRRTQNAPRGDPSGTEHQRDSSSHSPSTQSLEPVIVLPTPLIIPSAVAVDAINSCEDFSPVANQIRSNFICACHGISSCPDPVSASDMVGSEKVPYVVSTAVENILLWR